jgi:hypothetical protein
MTRHPMDEAAQPHETPVPSIDSVIAPWALPNEGIPLLFQWTPEDAIAAVRIRVPDGFRVAKMLNVAEESKQEGDLCRAKPAYPGYLGVHLANTRLPEEIVSGTECDVNFELAKGGLLNRRFRLTTVRPRLELLSAPTEIVLQDLAEAENHQAQPVVLSLRHTGLGFVQVQLKCTVKGVVVSQSDDVLRGLIRGILELQRASGKVEGTIRDPETEALAKKAGLEVEMEPISETDVEQVKNQVLGYLDTGALSDQVTGPEALGALRDFFATVDPKTLNELVRDQVINLYTRQLLEGMNRFPSDFSEIEGGPTKARLDSTMREMRITLNYSDSQGNAYEQIEVNLPITDRRTRKAAVIVPLTLNVENKLISEVPSSTWTP